MGSKSHTYRLDKQYLDATVQDKEQQTGALSPDWCEWLMGYPIRFTHPDPLQELLWLDWSVDPADMSEDGEWRTPSGQEPGVKGKRLESIEGGELSGMNRHFDKDTGRMAQIGLPQQVELRQMWPTPTLNEIEYPLAKLTNTNRRKTKDGKDSHSLCLADRVKQKPSHGIIPRVTTEKKRRVNRLKALGNAVVPQCVAFVLENMMGEINELP